MKLAIIYTVLASALTCGISEYISYKEIQKIDKPLVTVGYPALEDCKENQECSLACAKAFKMGVVKSLSECEY